MDFLMKLNRNKRLAIILGLVNFVLMFIIVIISFIVIMRQQGEISTLKNKVEELNQTIILQGRNDDVIEETTESNDDDSEAPTPTTTQTVTPTSTPSLTNTPTPSPSPTPTYSIESYGAPLISGSQYTVSQEFGAGQSQASLMTAGGTKITAVKSGTVTFAGWNGTGSGYMVIIDHGDGYSSRYLHGQQAPSVSQGSNVTKGQVIMLVGCTGNCVGNHLGLQLTLNGTFVNPRTKIPF